LTYRWASKTLLRNSRCTHSEWGVGRRCHCHFEAPSCWCTCVGCQWHWPKNAYTVHCCLLVQPLNCSSALLYEAACACSLCACFSQVPTTPLLRRLQSRRLPRRMARHRCRPPPRRGSRSKLPQVGLLPEANPLPTHPHTPPSTWHCERARSATTRKVSHAMFSLGLFRTVHAPLSCAPHPPPPLHTLCVRVQVSRTRREDPGPHPCPPTALPCRGRKEPQ
jgi:hypothetical protein